MKEITKKRQNLYGPHLIRQLKSKLLEDVYAYVKFSENPYY